MADLQAQRSGTNIDVTKFGSIMQYRNHQGRTVLMSGWGTDPPKMIEMWISEHYGQ